MRVRAEWRNRERCHRGLRVRPECSSVAASKATAVENGEDWYQEDEEQCAREIKGRRRQRVLNLRVIRDEVVQRLRSERKEDRCANQ